MRDNRATGCGVRYDVRQHAGDVLVGQAVKAVTAHAAPGNRGWQRERLRHLGLHPMKGGIEAGYLRQLWPRPGEDTDRRQVVRLMQGSKRRELLELVDHGRGGYHRLGELQAAMHDAVADCDQAMSFTVA